MSESNLITPAQVEKNKKWVDTQNALRKKHEFQPYTYLTEDLNNKITDTIDRGFNPAWALEDMATHLKLKAIETEDTKYLEMINYLKTQKDKEGETKKLREVGPNNYGATVKGKTIIMEGMKAIRAKQLKKDKDSIALYNHNQKVLKQNLTIEASTLRLQKDNIVKEHGLDEFNKRWNTLVVKASNIGMAAIVKEQLEIIDDLKVNFKEITDSEFQNVTNNLLKNTPTQDLLDYDFENWFRSKGILPSEKQQKNLEDRLKVLRDYQNLKPVKRMLEDVDSFIKDYEVQFDEIFKQQNPTTALLGISPDFNRAKRDYKRVVEDEVKQLYLEYMSKLENPVSYTLWDSDTRKGFEDALQEKMDILFPKDSNKGSAFLHLQDEYAKAPKPILEKDVQNYVKTLRAERADIESIPEDKRSSEDTEALNSINEVLLLLDKEGELKVLETKDKFTEFIERRLVTRGSRRKEDRKILETARGILLEGAKQGKEYAKESIEDYKAKEGIRFGTKALEQETRFIEAIVPPEETHASERISKYYGNRVRSIFPGFVEGFLQSTLRFDTTKKLERVPEAAVTKIDEATEKARITIQQLMSDEIDEIKKPYDLWTNKQKNDFTAKVKTTLTGEKGAFSEKHLSELRALKPPEEMDISPMSLLQDLGADGSGKKRKQDGERRLTLLTKDKLDSYYTLYIGGKAKTDKNKLKELAKYIYTGNL